MTTRAMTQVRRRLLETRRAEHHMTQTSLLRRKARSSRPARMFSRLRGWHQMRKLETKPTPRRSLIWPVARHTLNKTSPTSPGRCALPKWLAAVQVYSPASRRQQARRVRWLGRVRLPWSTTRSSSRPTSTSPRPTAHLATSMRPRFRSSSSKHNNSSHCRTTEDHLYRCPAKRGRCRPPFRCMTNDWNGQKGETRAATRRPEKEVSEMMLQSSLPSHNSRKGRCRWSHSRRLQLTKLGTKMSSVTLIHMMVRRSKMSQTMSKGRLRTLRQVVTGR
jgi:hypothetical protein